MPAHQLLLYDGVCGLCNRLNRFVWERDRDDRFRFASLQSAHGQRWCEQFAVDPTDLSTFLVIRDFETQHPTLLKRGEAAAFVLRELRATRPIGRILRHLPVRILDLGYDGIARRRYRWFGRHETCPIPPAEVRARFLGVD
ncbi:MAG: thiol-disulfide oxidoreductase DCC family protein [Thermoplasmatota archaeon]